MAVVYAAIVPHPPVIMPLVGRENHSRLTATAAAFARVAEGIRESGADTILLVSPHSEALGQAFTLNQRPEYRGDLEEFGDFGTKKTWTGNIGLAQLLKSGLKDETLLAFHSQEKLDHGSAIPLFLLTEKLPGIRIIPMGYSALDNGAHYAFGKELSQGLGRWPDKVAVVASGDLSHRLSRDAPDGFSPKAAKFDHRLVEYLSHKKNREIVNLNPELIADASECGLKSIIILLGILRGRKYEPKVLSYEAPFGVGYLVMEFRINN
jgi:aromatic ring-opening dioxygenase LigB subunit